MKTTLPARLSWLLTLYSFTLALVPATGLAQSKGTVDCMLEWHTSRRVYTYVFSGVVSSQGKPCPNAKIQIRMSPPNQDDVIQDTVASADGTYELKVTVAGSPEDSAEWKLVAQGSEIGLESAAIEGRAILMEDENTVMVERPIQLVQG